MADRHYMGLYDNADIFHRVVQPLDICFEVMVTTHNPVHDRSLVGEQVLHNSIFAPINEVVHLYHGSQPNRQYVERYRIFHDHAYDPDRDVEIDPETGLFQWSVTARERKSDLIHRVAEYFEQRREDE